MNVAGKELVTRRREEAMAGEDIEAIYFMVRTRRGRGQTREDEQEVTQGRNKSRCLVAFDHLKEKGAGIDGIWPISVRNVSVLHRVVISRRQEGQP